MQFKIPILCLFISWMNATLHAQENNIRWGKISEEELKMTTYADDTSAAALVLADVGYLTYDLRAPVAQTALSVHRRVKILKRSGFDQGDIQIPYSSTDRYQDITQLRAQIFNPDGTKRSVDKKDFFEEKTAEGYTTAKFTFPEIQVGSVIEYSYVKITKSWIQLPNWYFQEDIPVKLSEYTLLIPDVFEFVMLTRGRKLDRNELTLETNPSTNLRSRKYVLAAYNVPALKKEAFITTMTDYLSHVMFQLSSMTEKGMNKPFLSNWPTLAHELLAHDHFGKKIDRKSSFNTTYELAAPAVAAAQSPEEKVKAIYQFVLDHVKCNGDQGILLSEPLDKVLEVQKGSIAATNLMLVALLKAYGFQAHPMLLSTREHGQPIEAYPIVSQFNYVLARVQVGEKVYFLDATNPKRPMGFVAEAALNGLGWVVDEQTPFWEELKPNRGNTTRMFSLSLSDEGKAKGKYIAAYEGYAAINIREELSKKEASTSTAEASNEAETRDEDVSATAANIEYDSVLVRNLEDIYKSLAFNAKVTIADGAMVNGELMYVNAVFHPVFEKNPFKQTTREYPVDIAYPLTHRYVLNLDVPAGYSIEALPEQANLVLPNNGGKFTFLVSRPGGAQKGIQINSTIQINQTHFEPEEYEVIKKFFDLIIEKQQEQIVFKKR